MTQTTQKPGSQIKATINAPEITLTEKEKKILKHVFKMETSEFKMLAKSLQPICSWPFLWYKDSPNDDEYEPLCLNIYLWKANSWDEEKDYFNNIIFYVLSEYDYRLYRCKNFKQVSILGKALEKDYRIRYNELTIKPGERSL